MKKLLILCNDKDKIGGASIAAQSVKKAYHNSLMIDYNDIKKRFNIIENLISKILMPIFYIYNPIVKKYLNKIIIEEKIDICNLHLFVGKLSSSAVLTLFENNISIIHTVHDYRNICANNSLTDKNMKICESCKFNTLNAIKKNCNGNILISLLITVEALIRKKYLKIDKKINKYHFVSNFSKLKHIEFNNIYKNSVVFHNYVELGNEIIEKKTEKKNLIYVGRLSKEKGIIELIKRFPNDVILDIYGEGPQENEIKSLLYNKKNIKFYGKIQNKYVKSLISNYKYLICNPIWYENNPLTIIEAYSVGVPVIAPDIGGINEMILDKQLILDESKKINEIVNVPDEIWIRRSNEVTNLYNKKLTKESYKTNLEKIINNV